MPWNQRKALLTHHRWFRNLVDFHEMTRAWLEGADESDHAPHRLERATTSQIETDLHLLEALPDGRLDTLLDDTSPEDFLGRLEYSVWAVQAWSYTSLTHKLNEEQKLKLNSVLEQTTWKQGRAVAEKRWRSAEDKIRGSFRQDLRALFLTLVDSPMTLSYGEDAFLLRRGMEHELEFEFRTCAHFSRFPEVLPVADALCFLHSAWIRGYVYGLNNLVKIEYHPIGHTEGQRCWQHWKL